MKNNPEQGFTLVEMLLALTLFSLLSACALVIFKTVLNNGEITQRKSTQMIQLQRVLSLLERDLTHAIARTPNGKVGHFDMPEFSASQVVQEIPNYKLTLIRNHWPNPKARLPRSTLERVEYSWREERLERISYPNINSSAIATRHILLLEEVIFFQLRFYYRGKWLMAWHAGSFLPQAIEITIATHTSGQIKRIFLLQGD